MSDHDLHSLFTRERQLDSQRAPAFQHVLTRARQQVVVSPSHHLRWAAAVGTTAAVLALGWVLMRDDAPAPSLVSSLPVLLEAKADAKADAKASPLFPSLASSAETPSDFLMPRHTTFKVL